MFYRLKISIIFLIPVVMYGQKISKLSKSFPILKIYSSTFTNPPKDSAISLSEIDTLNFKMIKLKYIKQLCRTDSETSIMPIAAIYNGGRIICANNFTGYIINFKGSICDMQGSSFMYIYKKTDPQFCQEIRLGYSWACEGGEGGTESWILDYNDDGQADILQRKYYTYRYLVMDEKTGLDDLAIRNEEEFHLLLWDNGKFMESKVRNFDSLKSRFKITALKGTN
jgi:hypothetical protein